MTDALRRILWLFPILGAGALVVFFVLGSTSTVRRDLKQPLFFNDSPTSAQVAATQAIDDVLGGRVEGVRQLDVLGGAALPVVLERMKTMSVADQRAVAAALRPVAERIKRGDRSALSSQGRLPAGEDASSDALDRQLLFWERYRDEHALDLRPLATSRLVRRMSERDAGRKSADLVAVDTYALPHLVSAIGRISTRRDVERADRIIEHMALLTGQDWQIDRSLSPRQANVVATEVRRYWDAHGARFTQMDRLQLLAARGSQTEFWSWVLRSARQFAGQDDADLPRRIAQKARNSAGILIASLLGLLLVGPMVAAAIGVVQLRQSRPEFERMGVRASFAAALVLTATWLVADEGARQVSLVMIATTFGAASSAYILHRELNDRIDWRTHHVLRRRPRLARVFAVVRWLGPSIPTLTPIAIAEAVLFITCLEATARHDGLGLETLLALRRGDLDFLMAVCLGLGLITGAAQLVADLFLGDVRTRLGER